MIGMRPRGVSLRSESVLYESLKHKYDDDDILYSYLESRFRIEMRRDWDHDERV